MTRTELIKQAIESAKCRIYKLDFDLEGKLSAHHQKKAENQKELMKITVEALEKQIPKKVHYKKQHYGSPWSCPICEAEQIKVEFMRDDGTEPNEMHTYCWHCGNKIDWEEGGEDERR